MHCDNAALALERLFLLLSVCRRVIVDTKTRLHHSTSAEASEEDQAVAKLWTERDTRVLKSIAQCYVALKVRITTRFDLIGCL